MLAMLYAWWGWHEVQLGAFSSLAAAGPSNCLKQLPNPAAARSPLAPPQERIIFIDGAMGTMIQRYKLEEEDFRGER